MIQQTGNNKNNSLSIKEVAEILDCTRQQVYSLIWSGRLTANNPDKPSNLIRKWYVNIEDLDMYIRATGTRRIYFQDKLSTKEAAKISGLSWMHLNKLLRSGKLKAEKEVHGNRADWKIDRQVLLNFLEFRKTKDYRKKSGKIAEKDLD